MAECEFIVCAKAHETDCCAFCAEFPCQLIIDFNNSEAPHHHDVLENLRRARAIGKAAWLLEQQAFWRCPSCGGRIHWYQGKCGICGAEWEPVYKE